MCYDTPALIEVVNWFSFVSPSVGAPSPWISLHCFKTYKSKLPEICILILILYKSFHLSMLYYVIHFDTHKIRKTQNIFGTQIQLSSHSVGFELLNLIFCVRFWYLSFPRLTFEHGIVVLLLSVCLLLSVFFCMSPSFSSLSPCRIYCFISYS